MALLLCQSVLMLLQREEKCCWRRKKPLFEQLHHKLRGIEFCGIAGLDNASLAVLLQQLMNSSLLWCVLDHKRINNTCWKAGCAIPVRRQFTLQATYHHRIQ